ncbi:MAG: hypothetical protein ACOC8C_00535 [Chloroflexota bacterium]
MEPGNVEQVQLLRRWGTGVVNHVAHSSDGALLVIATTRGVYVYDKEELEQIRFIETGDQVVEVALLPNGETLIGVTGDGVATRWDVRAGSAVDHFETGSILWQPVFSSDASMLATVPYDADGDYNRIVVWDTRSGTELRKFDLGGKPRALAISPDDRLLAASTWLGHGWQVELWSGESGERVQVIPVSEGMVHELAFSSDSRLLAAACQDGGGGGVQVWETGSGEESFAGGGWPTMSVAFSPDGNTLASGRRDGRIALWNVSDGETVDFIDAHAGVVKSLLFSREGSILTSGSGDGTVGLWEVKSGLEQARIFEPRGHVLSVALSPDGLILASGEYGGTVRLWNTRSGREFLTLAAHYEGVTGLDFTQDGRMLASTSWDGQTKLWDVASGQELHRFTGGPSTSVAFSPDGTRLVCTSRTLVNIWNIEDQTFLHSVGPKLGSHVHDVAFLSDDRLVSSRDGLEIWDVSTGHKLAVFLPNSPLLSDIALSRDGRFLAAGASTREGQYVMLLDANTGRRLRTLDTGRTVALSPDGQLLATSSGETMGIDLWKVASGSRVARLDGHARSPGTLAFSSDGRLLASGSADGLLMLWGIASE